MDNEIYENEKEFEKWEKEVRRIEKPKRPSDINYMLRNAGYTVDYTRIISSEEFMKIYRKAINSLNPTDKLIMNLIFDSLGQQILTTKEISEITSIEPKEIVKTKKRVFKMLRSNPDIIEHKNNL